MSVRCDICGPNFIGRCPHGRAAPAAPPARLTEDELKLVAAQLTPEAANDFARMLREHGQPEGPAWDASEDALDRSALRSARAMRAAYSPTFIAGPTPEQMLRDVAEAGALLPVPCRTAALYVLDQLAAARSAASNQRDRASMALQERNVAIAQRDALLVARDAARVREAKLQAEIDALRQDALALEAAVQARIEELVQDGTLYPALDDGEMP